jgi:hypothetical protein
MQALISREEAAADLIAKQPVAYAEALIAAIASSRRDVSPDS